MEKRFIHEDVPPLDKEGAPKKKFQVMMRTLGPNPILDGVEKAVFIDGKKIDFKIDVNRFLEAKKNGGNSLFREQKRIEGQFVKAVSDVLGRKVLVEEIKRATLEGWI